MTSDAPPYSAAGLAKNAVPYTSLLDRIHSETTSSVGQSVQNLTQAAHEHEQAAEAEDAKLLPSPPHAPRPPPKRHKDGSFVGPPMVIRERVVYVEDCESGVIPDKTNELCKWDMQPIRGVPFVFPVKVDRVRGEIHVIGYTCSVSCALAYLQHEDARGAWSGPSRQWIAQFAVDYYGAKACRRLMLPAPPREKLSKLYADQVISGAENPMERALDLFRNGSEAIIYRKQPPVPFVRVTERIDEQVMQQERDAEHKDRLEMLKQEPQPILCTARGMDLQRKYVLDKRSGKKRRERGAIDTLLNITYE